MSPRQRPEANTLAGGRMPVVPPLAEREKPGLSVTLTGPIAPDRCRACGAPHVAAVPLARWVECDAWDRPTTTVVVLCRRCSDRLIEPHARLYHPLGKREPHAGAMSVCLQCAHRAGTSCRSPLAKFNGGPGLDYGWKDGKRPETVVAYCRPGGCRRITLWPGRVETCSGRAVAQLVRDDVPIVETTTTSETDARE